MCATYIYISNNIYIVIEKGKDMKYILMIIMFISCLLVCTLVNKSRKDRLILLRAIKESTSTCDIHHYFLSIKVIKNIYLSKLKLYVDDAASKRFTNIEVRDKIISTMPQVFSEKTDLTMLRRWLDILDNHGDTKKRQDVAEQCVKLMTRTKNEQKSNMYIAIALGIVLIIVVV